MRSWVFRNKSRLEALYGRPAKSSVRRAQEIAQRPRVVELVPAKRR